MAGRIRDTGAVQPSVRDTGQTVDQVNPEEVAKGLGAEPFLEVQGSGSHAFSMRILGPELARRTRSTGGRPGLDGANEPMRIPVRSEDAKRLYQVAEELGKGGVHVTPGQVGSVLIHKAASQIEGVPSVEIDEILEPLTTWTDRPYIAANVRPQLREADVLCGVRVHPRKPCGHRKGEIYDGEMCTHRVVHHEVIAIAIVDRRLLEPGHKCSVLLPVDPESGRSTDPFDYALLKYLTARLQSPFDAWDVRWTRCRHPHAHFAHVSPADPCPCESGRTYRECCLAEEGILRPHCEFIFSVAPPEHMMTIEYA